MASISSRNGKRYTKEDWERIKARLHDLTIHQSSLPSTPPPAVVAVATPVTATASEPLSVENDNDGVSPVREEVIAHSAALAEATSHGAPYVATSLAALRHGVIDTLQRCDVRYLAESHLVTLMNDVHVAVARSLRAMRLRCETAEALAQRTSHELITATEQYRMTQGQLSADETERTKKLKQTAKRERDQALRALTERLTKEFDEKQRTAVTAAQTAERAKGGTRAIKDMEEKLRAELKQQSAREAAVMTLQYEQSRLAREAEWQAKWKAAEEQSHAMIRTAGESSSHATKQIKAAELAAKDAHSRYVAAEATIASLQARVAASESRHQSSADTITRLTDQLSAVSSTHATERNRLQQQIADEVERSRQLRDQLADVQQRSQNTAMAAELRAKEEKLSRQKEMDHVHERVRAAIAAKDNQLADAQAQLRSVTAKLLRTERFLQQQKDELASLAPP